MDVNQREMHVVNFEASKYRILAEVEADQKSMIPFVRKWIDQAEHIKSKEKPSKFDVQRLAELESLLNTLGNVLRHYEENCKLLIIWLDDMLLSKRVINEGAAYRIKLSESIQYTDDLLNRIDQLEVIAGIKS